MMRHTLFSQFLLFSAVPVFAWAQSRGTFTSAGNLTAQRMYHSATVRGELGGGRRGPGDLLHGG
jgi:hypothetical protein